MSAPALIVAGGGTGGHVLAGVAIADAWRAQYGAQARVVFVGAEGGLEEKLVPRAGYPLHRLKLGALKGVGVAKRVRTLARIPLALASSVVILVRVRPSAVVGVGGYASGPLVLMARFVGWFWGARTAILEQNAVPGLTNRILGRLCHRVFSAFPGVEAGFPGQSVTVTGNPVRAEIRPQPPAARDPFTIFIFGGSQGALGINTLVLDALPHLRDLLPRLRFIHQTGERDFERVRAGHVAAASLAEVEKFVYDMPAAYGRASLLICRAGSGTLSEIAAVRRAAVLVPFPHAADNHQERNARIFVDAGAALLLSQGSARGEDLARIIRSLIEDPAHLVRMESAVAAFHRPDAARDLVRQLFSRA
jgi:UDP-N-acetylglucosamine--N-acetylmuramyl-(pentapeptide) pyrophosphoryl-undecaprenol N-acetylglucosamine transferase